MSKRIVLMVIAMAMAAAAAMPVYAYEEEKAAIEKIEEETLDADGNTTIDVSVSDAVTLPLELTLKGGTQTLRFSITYNGQVFRVCPGTYEVAKAVGGDGKKLSSGATLTIPEEGGKVYLDFTKPKTIFDGQLRNFLVVNALFLLFAFVAGRVFAWYRKSIS